MSVGWMKIVGYLKSTLFQPRERINILRSRKEMESINASPTLVRRKLVSGSTTFSGLLRSLSSRSDQRNLHDLMREYRPPRPASGLQEVNLHRLTLAIKRV